MDTDNLPQQEIKINDINLPLSNDENNIKENNIEEKENNNIDNSQPKLKLKKKVNKLKKPQENNIVKNEEVPIPDVEIELINDSNNVEENNNIINNVDIEENNIEIKNEENKTEENNIEIKNENNKPEENNKGYLDDDLEDDDNKKLYLRVIKRMEKTYGVPVISAEIKGEPIEDIELEENIRPILVGKESKNKKEIPKNNYIENKIKYNVNNNIINNNNIYKNKENIINNSYNIPNNRINNHINNNYYNVKRQYINSPIYNINNLVNSHNLNYNYLNNMPRNYLNNPGPYSKNINNNDLNRKYYHPTGKSINNINQRIIPNRGSSIHKPRKYSYEKVDKNFKKRLNNKYPIYNPNRIDIGMNKYKYKNLKYYNIGNDFPNNANFKTLNQKKYNYPLKRTYYISYNNKYKQNSNFSNSKPSKYRNYFNYNYNSISITRSPIVPKPNFKYFNRIKNNNKNYNIPNPLMNNNQIYLNNFVNNYKNKNIPLNKSQNILKGKNLFYNYTGNSNKNNYGRNDKNLLSLTQDVIGRSNNKLNKTPFHSYNNYHLNFNYSNEDNINNDYNSEIQMPMKEIKFTYYINSRYN